MKRPSHYVLVCAVVILAGFSVSGHLPVRATPSRAPANAPQIVRLDAPPRAIAGELLQGSVLDTMGFFVAGAELRSGDSGARTDSDGHFKLEVQASAAPLATALAIQAPGYRGASLPVWPRAREPLFVTLEPSAPWDAAAAAVAAPAVSVIGEGIVRGPDGKPIAGALVVLAETGALARTDELGRYALHLPADGGTLLVHQPDGGPTGNGLCARAKVPAPARDRGAVPIDDVIAEVAGALRGTVRGTDGKPWKGVPVQVVGDGFARTIASGESGSFRIGGLQRGRYEVRPFAFRGAFGSACTVDLQQPVVDCELRLQAAAERRVRVVTEAGAPVARAVVETRAYGVRRGIDRADQDGWVQVHAGDAAEYAVRTGDDYRPMRVVERDGTDRLIVALP